MFAVPAFIVRLALLFGSCSSNAGPMCQWVRPANQKLSPPGWMGVFYFVGSGVEESLGMHLFKIRNTDLACLCWRGRCL